MNEGDVALLIWSRLVAKTKKSLNLKFFNTQSPKYWTTPFNFTVDRKSRFYFTQSASTLYGI